MEKNIKNSADYYINYGGQIIDIKDTNKILALFTQGSGSGDNFDGYYGYSNYELYIPNKKDFGRTLIQVGKGRSNFHGYDISCSWSINETTNFTIDGIVIDSLFNTIFKKEIETNDDEEDVERNEHGDEFVGGCATCGEDTNSSDINGNCKNCK